MTQATPLPARRTAPPPPPKNASPGAAPTTGHFAVKSGRITDGPQRIVLYGPAGVGKSTLASLAPNPVFLDLEVGTRALDVPRIEGIETFADLRACIQGGVVDGYGTIVTDTATKVEEMAVAHTLATIPTDRGEFVTSVEGYGFGKGLQHVYDTFLLFLQDLDRQVRAGRSVILIVHDCTSDVPNPAGENYIRYEPRLQSPKSGKASIRHRAIEWADHVLFLGYDVNVTKQGKGHGAGTRTIWTAERPTHIAKSRTLPDTPIAYNSADDGTIWSAIFGGSK